MTRGIIESPERIKRMISDLESEHKRVASKMISDPNKIGYSEMKDLKRQHRQLAQNITKLKKKLERITS